MRKIVLCLIGFFVVTSLNATKYYHLDPSVDLSEFIDDIKYINSDNIVIYLSKGTYYLKKTLGFNVEHRAPITIEGRGRVIISGAPKIERWCSMPDELWRTQQPISYKIKHLIVNGLLATRAKTPNTGLYHLNGGKLVNKEGDNVEYKVFLSDIYKRDLEAIHVNEKPVINLIRLFTHSKSNIISINPQETSLTFTEHYGQSYFAPDSSTGIMLENYYAALDTPGEWYQDPDGYVYYKTREGEQIGEITICGARLTNLATISGSSNELAGNITFKGIIFEGCDVTASETGIPPYQSAYTLGGAVFAIYAKNVNIKNCEFRGLGGNAIWIMNNCEDCSISDNFIHDIGGGGIKIGGLKNSHLKVSKNIKVKNNIIQRFGRVYLGASGIFLTYASNCDILNNEISEGFYTGISVGFSWGYGETPTSNNRISYNKISNLGYGLLNDMAGIYTLGPAYGTVINNNVISNIISSDGDGFGIYTDEGSSDIIIENNVAYNCTGGGFHQHYGSNIIVRNNIFAFGEKANLLLSSVKKPEDIQLVFERNIVIVSEGDAISGGAINSDKVIFNNNCFYNAYGNELTINGKSLESWMSGRGCSFLSCDPCLWNPSMGDFRFKSSRVARIMGFKKIKPSNVGANWHP